MLFKLPTKYGHTYTLVILANKNWLVEKTRKLQKTKSYKISKLLESLRMRYDLNAQVEKKFFLEIVVFCNNIILK